MNHWQTSTTSYARNCASSYQKYSQKQGLSSSTQQQNHKKHYCLAGAQQLCHKGASHSSAGTNLRYQNRELTKLDNEISSKDDGEFFAALRPHHVQLKSTNSATFTLPATVNTAEITGSETFIHVKTNNEHWVVLTRGVHRVEPGQDITLHIDPDKLYLFDNLLCKPC